MPVPDDLAKSPYFSEDMTRHVGSYVDFVVNEFYSIQKRGRWSCGRLLGSDL